MSTKIKPQVGVVYECYKGFTDSHGDRCRVGQKFIFKGGSAYENDDYYYMDKASGRGAQIEIRKDKFASHFCPTNANEWIKQEEYITFKVGDEVMIDESSEYYGDDCSVNPKDTIGVISDINDNDFLNIIVDWSTGQVNSYNECDLKLAKQESDIQFKVGDEVMIDESSDFYRGSSTNPKDIIGVVVDILDDEDDDFNIIVDWSTEKINSYNKRDLKLAKQKSDIQFKVGDKVMIKESSCFYSEFNCNPKDTIGVISEIFDGGEDYDDFNIFVNWSNGHVSKYNKRDLKLAKQKSYIDSDKNKPLKQQVMINAIAITDPEQIKALAIAIPSIKPQLQAQFPELFITHKAGNRYENVDSGEEYILAHESDAVALVNLSTGTITSNTVRVDDIDNITEDEFARMVNNPSDYELL